MRGAHRDPPVPARVSHTNEQRADLSIIKSTWGEFARSLQFSRISPLAFREPGRPFAGPRDCRVARDLLLRKTRASLRIYPRALLMAQWAGVRREEKICRAVLMHI